MVQVCLTVGSLIGKEVGEAEAGPARHVPIQNCMAFPTPRNATAQCSDQANGVSCDACEHFGKPTDTGERDCAIQCTCIAFCTGKGMHAKPQDDGGDGLYSQLCLETGEWSDAYTSAETACVDVDECTSHPCLNGAECFATYPVAADSYYCACQPGSTGERCENDVNECGMPGTQSYKCINGGTCYESGSASRGTPPPPNLLPIDLGDFKCACQPTFSGKQCEATGMQCETNNPCENGASCVDINPQPGYACQCLGGYEGVNCGVDSSVSYLTFTESKSVAQAADTGEELVSTGAVDLTDDDLQFFDDDTCDPASSYGAPDPCVQTIGVLFRNVSFPRQLGYGTAAPEIVRNAKVAFKVKDIAPGNLEKVTVRIDVMAVANAPDLNPADHGISGATDPSCPQNQVDCFFPGPFAQAGVNVVSWDVQAAHNAGNVLETGDIKTLLNPLANLATWQPGSSVMLKFTLIPPPAPPYDPYHTNPVRGLRVFEAGGEYPKLTYTACATGTCTPIASTASSTEKTCKLEPLSIAHSKQPRCSYNSTPVDIAGRTEVRGPQTERDFTTSCQIQCCDGYRPAQGKSVEYRCAASGAWRDTDGGSVDISCENFDECASRPCQNGGACHMPDVSAITDTDDDQCAIVPKTNGHHFMCDCSGDAADFNGDLCQTKTDDCDSTPCHHGAECTDGVNAYTCACVAGYEGADCSTDIDECASHPCQNGGHCHDSSSASDNHIAPDAYHCTCVGAWQGNQCETDADNCDPNPCTNGGTCTTTPSGFTCACVAGWDGDACDEDIDECSSHPCKNDGVCSDSSTDSSIPSDAFQCACTQNYRGVTCSTQEDVCASSPCQNGGDCAEDTAGDGTAVFTCHCAHGWGGADGLCSEQSVCNGGSSSQIDCQNGGTCVDDASADLGYTCDCGTSGYNGAHCETNTDDCDGDRNNCKNGINEDGSLKADGTCVDAINSVTCTCHHGFSGATCEDAAPVCAGTNPCENGGACHDDTSVEAGFTCDCVGGHTGATCSNSQDFCQPDPCQNEAECSNGDDSFTCACVAGTPTAGQHCDTCADGKQPNEDQSSCQDCPAGKYGSGGSCTFCEDGKEPDAAKTQCTSCPAGKATKTPGTGRCETCDAGHEPMPVGSDAATQPAGRACQSCEGEQYSTDGVQCVACDPGKQPHADHSSCDVCEDDSAGQNGQCKQCKPGKMPDDDHTHCIDCGPDKFSAHGGACEDCPDGQTVNADHSGCDGGR